MSLDTSKIVKKITYNGVEFVQAGSSNVVNDLISGTITEVTSDTLGGVESIRNNAFSGMEIETVSVPSNVTSVGDSAFANNNITTLTIDEGVQTIGNNAFQNNSIETVTIPSTVTSIGDDAFSGNNLTEITMESDNPPIVTSTTFPSTLQTTNVSYNSYENYSTDPNWTTYKNTLVRGLAIPSTITVTVNNYLGELVNGASVTISGNGQTYMGTTNESGVFTQGDLQPATYTISVADLEGFKTPDAQEVVVEQDTQNSVTVTYLEKSEDVEIVVDRVFSNNTPQAISYVGSEIASKGYTSAQVEEVYGWKIGDITSYALSTGENVEMRIIGFNHDDLADGSGKAGITLEMKNCLSTKYPMNATATNSGGWESSVMRTTTLPEIKATLPQAWQDAIVTVAKKTSRGPSTSAKTTSEELFLLSVIELTGGFYNAQAGYDEGTQYEYWIGRNNEYYKWQKTVGGSSSEWYVRSTAKDTTTYFSGVSSDGRDINQLWASNSYGVSYAFCVGAPRYNATFSKNTPAQIAEISAEISANNMTSEQVATEYGWNIGDTISYQLTTGENVEMRIIGFNHDDKSDGSGKAGITLDMTHCLKVGNYRMMNSMYNNGGWNASAIRTGNIPTIKSTLPQEWQDVIVSVNKKSANGGGSYYTETVTTVDDLFLLSEIELFGSSSAQAGETEGTRYEYWSTNAFQNKQYDSNSDGIPDTNASWWLRSCGTDKSYVRAINNANGRVNSFQSNDKKYLSYAFCI